MGYDSAMVGLIVVCLIASAGPLPQTNGVLRETFPTGPNPSLWETSSVTTLYKRLEGELLLASKDDTASPFMLMRKGLLLHDLDWRLKFDLRFPAITDRGNGFTLESASDPKKRVLIAYGDKKVAMGMMASEDVKLSEKHSWTNFPSTKYFNQPATWQQVEIRNTKGNWTILVNGELWAKVEVPADEYLLRIGTNVSGLSKDSWTEIAVRSVEIEYANSAKPKQFEAVFDALASESKFATSASIKFSAAASKFISEVTRLNKHLSLTTKTVDYSFRLPSESTELVVQSLRYAPGVTSPGVELLYATAGLVSGREAFSLIFEDKQWHELRGLLPKETLSGFENLMLDYGDRCKEINEIAHRFMSTAKGTNGYTNEEIELIRSFGRQFEAAEVLRFKAAVALHTIAEGIGLKMRSHVLYITEIAQRNSSLGEIIAVAQSTNSSFNSTSGRGTYRVEWWKKKIS